MTMRRVVTLVVTFSVLAISLEVWASQRRSKQCDIQQVSTPTIAQNAAKEPPKDRDFRCAYDFICPDETIEGLPNPIHTILGFHADEQVACTNAKTAAAEVCSNHEAQNNPECDCSPINLTQDKNKKVNKKAVTRTTKKRKTIVTFFANEVVRYNEGVGTTDAHARRHAQLAIAYNVRKFGQAHAIIEE